MALDKKNKQKLRKFVKLYGHEWVVERVEQTLAKDIRLADLELTPNFVETDNIESANTIDLNVYRFVDYSDRKFIFVRRKKKDKPLQFSILPFKPGRTNE